jgi:hypothetical protein
MPDNIFPLVVGDPTLKTCRNRVHPGDRRVGPSSMCKNHPRTCLTCCGSRLKRRCGLEPWEVPAEPYFADWTWEERQAEMAQMRQQLGFRPLYDYEIAEEARRREHHA